MLDWLAVGAYLESLMYVLMVERIFRTVGGDAYNVGFRPVYGFGVDRDKAVRLISAFFCLIMAVTAR